MCGSEHLKGPQKLLFMEEPKMRVVDAGSVRNRVQWLRNGVGESLCAAGGRRCDERAAQVLYGTVTGEVTDPTGADIPNATVNLTNQANGQTRSTTTGSHGEYTVPNLEPGPYTVAVPAMASFGGYSRRT